MTAQALFAPAMVRALELAQNGPERGINPRVGCVLIDSSGTIVAEGWHQGSGAGLPGCFGYLWPSPS